MLDIGCGGGLVSEPLARLGASVTGIDPAPKTIEAAKAHARGARLAHYLSCRYRGKARGEQAPASIPCCLLEVVEHVPEVPQFLAQVAPLVKPGGMMIVSTINRTLKAYTLVIIGAELILRWLPPGTHNWARFITPDELRSAVRAAGLTPTDVTGMVYDPLADAWRLATRDSDVNYFATAVRG